MPKCTRNVELFYLLKKLTPDFRTISDFRKDNTKALKNTFRAFVKLCMKLDLYQKELLAIDGSKFRAVNSKDNTYNAEILEKKLKRIDEHILDYLYRMDQEDKSEPEARRMHSKDGFHCCYNIQTAVDKGSHLIADYEVTNRNTDQGLLKQVAQNAKEILEIETVEVVADKGYESRQDILNCVMNGIVPNVALKYDKHERLYAIDYEDTEITEEIKNSKKSCQCPNRCTGGKSPKTVSFGPKTKYVPVRMYGSPSIKLNPVPADIPLNPFNHTLDRKDYIPRKVVLRIKEDIAKWYAPL